MLSGQITPMQINEATAALFDGIEEALVELVHRNLRLLEQQRGVVSLTYEQCEFVKTLTKSTSGNDLLAFVIQSKELTEYDALLCKDIVEQSHLELRGKL